MLILVPLRQCNKYTAEPTRCVFDLRLIVVDINLCIGRQDVDRGLAVLLTELECFLQLVLRKQFGTVKIVKAVVSVKPAAHIAVVLQGMSNHKVELIARMAVLSGGIAHGDALRRHGHRLDVNGEPVGVALAEIPNGIGHGRNTSGRRRRIIFIGGAGRTACRNNHYK